MSFLGSLDAAGLRGWASRATGELSRRRAEINALNVFPVPDSDTGSNMAYTMEAALREADQHPQADLGGVAQALAVGSVRGARGNSGLVLSQVLRGVAETVHDGPLDGQVLADALTLAVRLVSRAIAQPVEGTVVTVLRAAAEAAEDAAEDDPHLEPVAQAAVEAARIALHNTPSLLPELAAAGVVDAGGAGLVVLLESLLSTDTQPAPSAAPAEEGDWMEVMFFFRGDVDELQARLDAMGNCLVVAPAADDAATVHLHTTVAGPVIEEAFATAQVSDLRLEVLPAPSEPAAGSEQVRRVIAVAPDGAVAKLFAAAGVDVVAPGQSAGETQDNDIFLTNGTESETGRCQVVPTGSFVAGLAALSVYEPGTPDTTAMAQAMQEVADSMRVEILDEETPEAVEEAGRRLLAAGGEQVTVLSAQPIDSVELGERLGAEVAALQVPGIATEVGVE